MKARKVAARFAARTWYEEVRGGRQSREETVDFVRSHWQTFLPVANVGLGRLLLRIVRVQRRKLFRCPSIVRPGAA
jgi:hypothetical protein